jgi:hypothetical protein
MQNCPIRYPDSFEPKLYGSSWIGFILQGLLTVQCKGKGQTKCNGKCKGNGKGKGKVAAIPAHAWTIYEGPRILSPPHFRTVVHECSKCLSPKHQPPLPQINNPGINFSYRTSQPQGHSAARSIMPLKISRDVIGKPDRNHPAYVAVHQPSALWYERERNVLSLCNWNMHYLVHSACY